jgi:hypothetical protein
MWYPDTSLATDKDPPLYLHITAATPQELNKGIAAVQDLMQQELGPLTEKFEKTRVRPEIDGEIRSSTLRRRESGPKKRSSLASKTCATSTSERRWLDRP